MHLFFFDPKSGEPKRRKRARQDSAPFAASQSEPRRFPRARQGSGPLATAERAAAARGLAGAANSRSELARPAGLEPATPGLEGRLYGPARDRPRRFPLILRPVSRVGGNCFPPQTVTACHTCVTRQPFNRAAVGVRRSNRWLVRYPEREDALAPRSRADAHIHSADKTGRTRVTSSSACRRLGSVRRSTTMPTYSLGGYARMSAKSRSSVKSTPRICLARRCNLGIVRARESFVVDGVALPAGCAQEFGGLDGQVLIELRAHTAKLRRKGQDSLLRQVGGIRQRRLNARRRERGVALEDLLGGQPVCQVRQDHGNGNSRTRMHALPWRTAGLTVMCSRQSIAIVPTCAASGN